MNIQKALLNGDITKARVDDAVRRILTVKFEAGLFDRPKALSGGLSVIGSDLHRKIAREAVYKSQVLLKNENFVLPLSTSSKKILVAEMNMGQMVEDVKLAVNGVCPVEFLGAPGGAIFSEDEIIAKIKGF